MIESLRAAPPLSVSQWLNTPKAISLDALRGRVVVLEAFQMLCPGCVAHGLPQAQRVFETFRSEDVAVIGLHTVFEHHDAQGTAPALKAFLHEYRVPFPVGIDAPSARGPIPVTMAAYAMQGTPTLILIDRQGRLRAQYFGSVPDLALGAAIARLALEPGASAEPEVSGERPQGPGSEGCGPDGCPAP